MKAIIFSKYAFFAVVTSFAATQSLEEQIVIVSKSGSVSNLHLICIEAEAFFSGQPDQYFRGMDSAVNALESWAKTNPAAKKELELQLTNSLNHSCPTDPVLSHDCFIVKANMAAKLIELFKAATNPPALEPLAKLIGEVRLATVSNYIPATGRMNVMPPSYPLVGNEKEYLEEKQRFEKEVRENDRRKFQNGLQQFILPRIENDIRPAFLNLLNQLSTLHGVERVEIDRLSNLARLSVEERKRVKGSVPSIDTNAPPQK